MEGWLQKKGTAELTNFGRKTWRKRWCVLDADTHVFSYYEGYDASANEPTVKRGAMHVANYNVKAVDHHERNYVFMLKEAGDGGTGKPVYLQADTKGQLDTWLHCFTKASTVSTGAMLSDRRSVLKVLGLDPDETPTVDDVHRAWKKVAYKHHPDRGGDLEVFLQIKAVCELLVHELQEEEMYEKVTFSAQIERGPPATGFGMKVVQIPQTKSIEVEEIMPDMRLRSIGPAADGAIWPHDILIGVEDDDITDWTFDRIGERLSDQRIPVGATTMLYFQRKLRRDDAPDAYFEEEGYEEEQSEGTPNNRAYNNSPFAHVSDDGTPSPYDDETDIFLSRNARERLARQKAEQEMEDEVMEAAVRNTSASAAAATEEDRAGRDYDYANRLPPATAADAARSAAESHADAEASRKLTKANSRLEHENALLRSELMAFKKMNDLEREDNLDALGGAADTLQSQALELETKMKVAAERIAAAAERDQKEQGRLVEGLVQQYGRVVIEMCQRVSQSKSTSSLNSNMHQDRDNSMFATTSRGPLGTMVVPVELENYLTSLGSGLGDLPDGAAGRSLLRRDNEERNMDRRTAVLAAAFLDPLLAGSTRGRAAMSTLKTKLGSVGIAPGLMSQKWRGDKNAVSSLFDRLEAKLVVEHGIQETQAAQLAEMEGRAGTGAGANNDEVERVAHMARLNSASATSAAAAAATKQLDVGALLDRKLKLAGRR